MTGLEMRQALIGMGVNYFTADTFISYHKKYPQIMKAFEQEAFAQIERGQKQLRAKDIAENIRGRAGSIQNSMISYYGRAFVIKYPQHKSMFVFKETKGVKTLWEA
jgi:hypothetical protein